MPGPVARAHDGKAQTHISQALKFPKCIASAESISELLPWSLGTAFPDLCGFPSHIAGQSTYNHNCCSQTRNLNRTDYSTVLILWCFSSLNLHPVWNIYLALGLSFSPPPKLSFLNEYLKLFHIEGHRKLHNTESDH